MLKFIILKTKIHRKDQGFTMLEVLVAGLIAFFFIIGSLQAMVLATMLRVQSLEKERANELIQEDKEAIKARANNFAIPVANADPTLTELDPAETSLTAADTNLSNLCNPTSANLGFARLFRDAPTQYANNSTKVGGLGEASIGTAIPLDVPTNKKVLNSYSSNDTSATSPGRTLRLFRTYTIGQYPFKTLIINYQVNRVIQDPNDPNSFIIEPSNNPNDPNNTSSLIATDTLEVMPNVALQCP
jgi:Tfp pilus assembly protein PilV